MKRSEVNFYRLSNDISDIVESCKPIYKIVGYFLSWLSLSCMSLYFIKSLNDSYALSYMPYYLFASFGLTSLIIFRIVDIKIKNTHLFFSNLILSILPIFYFTIYLSSYSSYSKSYAYFFMAYITVYMSMFLFTILIILSQKTIIDSIRKERYAGINWAIDYITNDFSSGHFNMDVVSDISIIPFLEFNKEDDLKFTVNTFIKMKHLIDRELQGKSLHVVTVPCNGFSSVHVIDHKIDKNSMMIEDLDFEID